MNLSEFKAWFEGFTEGMDGPPNEAQWNRIQERLATVTAISIQPPMLTPHPAPAVDPRRQILGQAQAAQVGYNNLNAAPPADNGVGAMAFAARTRPMDDSDCRPVDVAAELRALGKAEAKAA